MTTASLRVLTVLVLVTAVGNARAQSIGGHSNATAVPATTRLFAVTTDDFAMGTALDVRGGPPWDVLRIASTTGARSLRQFGADLFLIHPNAGTIERVRPGSGLTQTIDLGPASEPQDVHVVPASGSVAWVTRRQHPWLHRIDLATGNGVDVIDLSPIGGGAAIALGTMERDGTYLFVQVKIFAPTPGADDTGALAVVDLATESLVDVDPVQPGVQGVALQGAPPRLKMQIVEGTRTLFVSATEGVLDGRGAIEMVDLDLLSSIGFALSEQQIADLGGFVMTSADAGYFVFHTDFAASTHLKSFTIQGGPSPGPEILVLLGDQVEVLAYDERMRRLFLPSGFAGGPIGIYAIDTITNRPLSAPIPTGARPHDVILSR